MSVYTPLSLEEVQAFAEPYGLAIIDLIPIQGGIQNTNYFLVDQSKQHYVLTVFEELDAEGAGELVPVLDCLGKAGVPVAVPLKYNGQAIHSIADKPAQIAPRLMGEHPNKPVLNMYRRLLKRRQNCIWLCRAFLWNVILIAIINTGLK